MNSISQEVAKKPTAGRNWLAGSAAPHCVN
jgi:hypothetical protein